MVINFLNNICRGDGKKRDFDEQASVPWAGNIDLIKTLMYEFHYDYMRSRYGSKFNLCYMDTDSFVYEIESEDFYGNIAKDLEKRFDMNQYSKDDKRPLPIGKNKKVIGMMKDELDRKIMTEFVALRAKMYAYRKIEMQLY